MKKQWFKDLEAIFNHPKIKESRQRLKKIEEDIKKSEEELKKKLDKMIKENKI